jgi:hypothetical protein
MEALMELMACETCLRANRFHRLHARVRLCKLNERIKIPLVVDAICEAINMVCLWYPKRILCLQRSVATARLMRRYGLRAEMVIGTQQIPFRSHAWVEVDGQIVNERIDVRQIYTVLDRC